MSDKHPWERLNFELTQFVIKNWESVEHVVRKFGLPANQALISYEKTTDGEVFHISTYNILEGSRTVTFNAIELCEKLALLFVAHKFLKDLMTPEFLSEMENAAERIRELGLSMKNGSEPTPSATSSLVVETNERCSSMINEDSPQNDSSSEQHDQDVTQMTPIEEEKSVEVGKVDCTSETLKNVAQKLEKVIEAEKPEKLEKGEEHRKPKDLENGVKNEKIEMNEVKMKPSNNSDVVESKVVDFVKKQANHSTKRKRRVSGQWDKTDRSSESRSTNLPCQRFMKTMRLSSGCPPMNAVNRKGIVGQNWNLSESDEDSENDTEISQKAVVNNNRRNETATIDSSKVVKQHIPSLRVGKDVPSTSKQHEPETVQNSLASFKKHVPTANKTPEVDLLEIIQKQGKHSPPITKVVPITNQSSRRVLSKATAKKMHLQPDEMVVSNIAQTIQVDSAKLAKVDKKVEEKLDRKTNIASSKGSNEPLPASVGGKSEERRISGSKLLVKNILSPETEVSEPPLKIVLSSHVEKGEEGEITSVTFKVKDPPIQLTPSNSSNVNPRPPIKLILPRKKPCPTEMTPLPVVENGNKEKTTNSELVVENTPSTHQPVELSSLKSSVESPQTHEEVSSEKKDKGVVSSQAVENGEAKTSGTKLVVENTPSTHQALASLESSSKSIPQPRAEVLLKKEGNEEENQPSTSGTVDSQGRNRVAYYKGQPYDPFAFDEFMGFDKDIDPATGQPIFKDLLTPLMYDAEDYRKFNAKYDAKPKPCNVLVETNLFCQAIECMLKDNKLELDLKMDENGVKIGFLYEVNKGLMLNYSNTKKRWPWLENFKVDRYSHYPESALNITKDVETKSFEEIYKDDYESFFEEVVSLESFQKQMDYVLNRQLFSLFSRFPNGENQPVKQIYGDKNENGTKFVLPGGAMVDIQSYTTNSPLPILDKQNWKQFNVGNLVWAKFNKDWWPAVIIGLDNNDGTKEQPKQREPKIGEVNNNRDELILQVRYLTGDRSFYRYEMVDHFDLSFSIRFDASKKDQKYLSAVVFNIRQLKRKGYFEEHITPKVAAALQAEGWKFNYLTLFQKKRLFEPHTVQHLPDPMLLTEYLERVARVSSRKSKKDVKLIYEPFALIEKSTKRGDLSKLESKRLATAAYNVDLQLFNKYMLDEKKSMEDAPIIYQPSGYIEKIFKEENNKEPSPKKQKVDQ